MVRVTRSKSKSSERPETPIVEHEEEEEEVKREVTRQRRTKIEKPTKEPIRKKQKTSASHQLIQQFTKKKLESLKPSYKPVVRRTVSQEQQQNDKICPTTQIENVANAFKSTLQNQQSLKEQVELVQKFTMFKNMKIDIRTIEILKNSTLCEYDDYDLKLRKLRDIKDHDEQLKKFHEIYDERRKNEEKI